MLQLTVQQHKLRVIRKQKPFDSHFGWMLLQSSKPETVLSGCSPGLNALPTDYRVIVRCYFKVTGLLRTVQEFILSDVS